MEWSHLQSELGSFNKLKVDINLEIKDPLLCLNIFVFLSVALSPVLHIHTKHEHCLTVRQVKDDLIKIWVVKG